MPTTTAIIHANLDSDVKTSSNFETVDASHIFSTVKTFSCKRTHFVLHSGSFLAFLLVLYKYHHVENQCLNQSIFYMCKVPRAVQLV
jgi:hypothetical protein